jgi:hypothetical protein
MTNRKNRITFWLLGAMLSTTLCAGVLVTSATPRERELCFMSQGLKNRTDVKLTMHGARVLGSYHIVSDDDSRKPVKRKFNGTRKHIKNGWYLTIYFADGAPYQLPPKTKRIAWRLGNRNGREVLVVPTYGKNYQTEKYAAYEMVMDSCAAVFEENGNRP